MHVLKRKSTYVAAAETCPLLVRWAPKCICMHLSRQQRSGWKQNRAQEDTCTWANTLATAKGKSSQIGRGEQGHFTISSSHCGPEERSSPKVVQTGAFSDPFFFALCGAQRTGCFYPRWRRANTFILSYKGRGRKKKSWPGVEWLS